MGLLISCTSRCLSLLLIVGAAFILAAAPAHADCINPAGPEGKIVYNVDYKTPQYCNGSVWIAMGAVQNTTTNMPSLTDVDDALAPNDGDCLVYNNGSSQWESDACSSGALAALTDVDVAGAVDGACLVYNNGTSTWEDGSCGAGDLPALTDVDDTLAPNGGDCLIYNSGATQWESGACGSGGGALTAGSPDQVIFNSGGTLTGSNNLVFTSAGQLAIGTSTPLAALTVTNETNAGVLFEQYNNSDGVNMRSYAARGTKAVPAAVLADNRLLALSAFGYEGAGFVGPAEAQISMYASENYSAAANGTYMTFATTPNGTTTATERMRITADGDVAYSSGAHLNFGTAYGDTGYGIRDNAGTIECKNSGGGWTPCQDGAGGVTADSLDFTEFKDALALDASTDIATGANTLSITNDGSGTSLRVNDNGAADASPFVVDASGNIGIGTAAPTTGYKMEIFNNSAPQLALRGSWGGGAGLLRFQETSRNGFWEVITRPAAVDAVGDMQWYANPNGSNYHEYMAFKANNALDTTPGNVVFPGKVGIGADADIATGANTLSITNDGSGTSLRVNDNGAADASPFVVDASGNIGIGTAAPTTGYKMEIFNNSAPQLALRGSWGGGAGLLRFQETSRNGFWEVITRPAAVDAVGDMQWYANPNGSNYHEYMAFKANNALDTTPGNVVFPGKVGIGAATTPANPLLITDTTNSLSGIQIAGTDAYDRDIEFTNTTNNKKWNIGHMRTAFLDRLAIGHFDGATWIETLSIASPSGNVGIGDNSPDHKFDVNGNIGLTASSYINFGDTDGTTGYGIRDNAGTIECKNSSGAWSPCQDGAGGVTADSLDFTEFKDAMALDASTDIATSGTQVLSITNGGTGNSFVVNDATGGDTSPFVIDASGNVGVATATPGIEGTIANPVVMQVVPTTNFGTGAIKLGSGLPNTGNGMIEFGAGGYLSGDHWLWKPTFGMNLAVKSPDGSSTAFYTPRTLTAMGRGYGGISLDFNGNTHFYGFCCDTVGGATVTPTDRMTILADGSVGINQPLPGAQLAIKQADADTTQLMLGVQSSWSIGTYSEIAWSGAATTAGNVAAIRVEPDATGDWNMHFLTATGGNGTYTTQMTITDDGNVGIGTTGPQSLLQVANTGYAQFSKSFAGAPSGIDCDNAAEAGRITFDTTNSRWYLCDGSGWIYASMGTSGGAGDNLGDHTATSILYLNGNSSITANPPAAGSNVGWKVGLWGNTYALGIANYTVAAKTAGWLSVFSGNPANDGTAGVPDSNAKVSLNGANGNGVFTGTITANEFSGSGASLTTLNAGNLGSGTVPLARLGASGTPSTSTFLRGDNTWQAVSVSESDPQVGSVFDGTWCYGNSSNIVECSADSLAKDDITLRTNSGFWETSTATTAEGWPTTTNSWYHLLSSTHSNDTNYHAMQFAAPFFNANELYFRVTANVGTAPWNKMWHAGNDGAASGLDADTLDGLNSTAFLQSESDPQVNATTNNLWCRGTGTQVTCDQAAPGGGTPGGSNTQIQFNNSGAFGGSANLTWNNTLKNLLVTTTTTGIGAITSSTANGDAAIYGTATGISGEVYGVAGASASPDGYGVYGLGGDGGSGVYGTVITGSGAGLYGYSSSDDTDSVGVYADGGQYGTGVYATGNENNPAIFAEGGVDGIAVIAEGGVLALQAMGNVRLSENNSYLNFGVTTGSGGYGIRDNAGTIEVKNSGGSWAAPGAGAGPGMKSMQVFTANGTWSRPAGVTRIMIKVVAGGGNGGSSNGFNTGAGGGGGATCIKFIDVSAIPSVAVTVGGAASDSSFGAHCTAGGGTNASAGTGGTGGTASGGNINMPGEDSANAGGATTGSPGTFGGSSTMGFGGKGGTGSTAPDRDGSPGKGYGAGGGGGAKNNPSSGGAGAPGIVWVQEY